jgi:O-succinylbenzoate synthase
MRFTRFLFEKAFLRVSVPLRVSVRAWRLRSAGARNVVLRAAPHVRDLAEQIVDRVVAPAEIQLRGLDHEERGGGVVKEEVVVGLADLGHVLFGGRRGLVFGPLGPLAREPLERIHRGLQKNDQIGLGKIARDKVEQLLVDEEFVIVEIGERVDPIAIEREVADDGLSEQVALPQRLQAPLTGQGEEELGLERGAGAAGVKIREERFLLIITHDRRVESRAQSLRQRGLAQTRRPLDGEVAEVHAARRYHTPVRVAAVELFLIRLPLVRPFETSFGRIDARELVLVRVDDDSGATGWGECVAEADPFYSAETTVTAWHILARYLIPNALGEDIRASECAARWGRVRGHQMAKAALEMALWDLEARLAARPLCELLGAPARPIAAGVSIGIDASIGALLDRVAEERAAGYRRVKIKIKPGWDRAPVEAIRERFGGLPLMVDANAAYTAADGPHLAALDAFDLMMIEQPLEYDDLLQHARLQTELRTPICLDESIHSPGMASDALDLGACRIINIKPGRLGGHGPSRAVHDLARARGIPVWHGGMLETGIGRAHNLHLSTLPGFTLPGDVAASRRYFVPDLIEPPIDVDAEGMIRVPDGPGIGVEPVPERLARATVRQERFTA